MRSMRSTYLLGLVLRRLTHPTTISLSSHSCPDLGVTALTPSNRSIFLMLSSPPWTILPCPGSPPSNSSKLTITRSVLSPSRLVTYHSCCCYHALITSLGHSHPA